MFFTALGYHNSGEDSSTVYNSLLIELIGTNDKNFVESIIEDIINDNGRMAELAAEADAAEPSKQQIIEAAEEELVVLQALMSHSENIGTVMAYVDDLKEASKSLSTGSNDKNKKDAVIINTMHSWKGLEVPKLFVPMVRGKFPRSRPVKGPEGEMVCSPPDPESLPPERRLAYVAITRAEDECVILDIPNPKMDCPPSQFISEACVPFVQQEGVPEGE